MTTHKRGVKAPPYSPLWTDKHLEYMFKKEYALFTNRGRYMQCRKCLSYHHADTALFKPDSNNKSGLQHRCRHCLRARATELRGWKAAKSEGHHD